MSVSPGLEERAGQLLFRDVKFPSPASRYLTLHLIVLVLLLIDASTLPPGRNVATNPNFKGNLKLIDEEFLEHIQAFMTSLLHPRFCSHHITDPYLAFPSCPLTVLPVFRNLVVKVMGGKEVKAKEMVQYFKSYMEVFKVTPNTNPESPNMTSQPNPGQHYARGQVHAGGDHRSEQPGQSGQWQGIVHDQVTV